MALDFGLRDTDITRIYHTMQGDVTGVETGIYFGDDADFDQDEVNEEVAESSAVENKSEALAEPHTATASEDEEVLYDILAGANFEPSVVPFHANATTTGISEPINTDCWNAGFPDLFHTNDSYEGLPDLFGANGSFTEFPHLFGAEENTTEQPATTHDPFQLLHDQDETISAQCITIANLHAQLHEKDETVSKLNVQLHEKDETNSSLSATVAKLKAYLAEAKASIDFHKRKLDQATMTSTNGKTITTGKKPTVAALRHSAKAHTQETGGLKRKLAFRGPAGNKRAKVVEGEADGEAEDVPEYTPLEPIEASV